MPNGTTLLVVRQVGILGTAARRRKRIEKWERLAVVSNRGRRQKMYCFRKNKTATQRVAILRASVHEAHITKMYACAIMCIAARPKHCRFSTLGNGTAQSFCPNSPAKRVPPRSGLRMRAAMAEKSTRSLANLTHIERDPSGGRKRSGGAGPNAATAVGPLHSTPRNAPPLGSCFPVP
jgi:hypothetical protein